MAVYNDIGAGIGRLGERPREPLKPETVTAREDARPTNWPPAIAAVSKLM